MSKYTKKMIEKIKTMTESEIPALIRQPGITYSQYCEARIKLNLNLICALTGGELTDAKKKHSAGIKFCHELPNKRQLTEICALVNTFIGTYEKPFLDQCSAAMANQIPVVPGGDGDDMSIPAKTANLTLSEAPVKEIKKVNKKKLAEYIMKDSDNDALSQTRLRGQHCLEIAALAEEMRDNSKKKTRWFVIGGIVLAVAAGVAIGLIVHKKMKDKEDAELEKTIDAALQDEIDSSEPGVTEVDLDEDIPEVDLDD